MLSVRSSRKSTNLILTIFFDKTHRFCFNREKCNLKSKIELFYKHQKCNSIVENLKNYRNVYGKSSAKREYGYDNVFLEVDRA